MVSDAESSFSIVPVLLPSPIATFIPVGLESVKVKVSSGSTTPSPEILIITVLLLSPAAKLSVPEAAV